jgi:hypothetical protein
MNTSINVGRFREDNQRVGGEATEPRRKFAKLCLFYHIADAYLSGKYRLLFDAAKGAADWLKTLAPDWTFFPTIAKIYFSFYPSKALLPGP